jgi:hypothetical protein
VLYSEKGRIRTSGYHRDRSRSHAARQWKMMASKDNGRKIERKR